jgi:hypothetical protein
MEMGKEKEHDLWRLRDNIRRKEDVTNSLFISIVHDMLV